MPISTVDAGLTGSGDLVTTVALLAREGVWGTGAGLHGASDILLGPSEGTTSRVLRSSKKLFVNMPEFGGEGNSEM